MTRLEKITISILNGFLGFGLFIILKLLIKIYNHCLPYSYISSKIEILLTYFGFISVLLFIFSKLMIRYEK